MIKSLARREDLALVQGGHNFLADLCFPLMKEAVFIRSPHPHAKIRGLKVDDAFHLDRSRRVIAAADLPRTAFHIPSTAKHSAVHSVTDPVLAYDEVRYIGEPVAVVLGENRYAAEDAAELVDIDYEVLAACVDIEDSLTPGSPLVHPHIGSNLAGKRIWEIGNHASVLQRSPPYVISRKLRIHRGTSSPLETRGIVAVPTRGHTVLDIWSSTQSPYRLRDLLAETLGLAPERIRVIAPLVGGGFGPKSGFYPEDFVIPCLALATGSRVRWIEDRREHLLRARQERDQIPEVTVAFDEEGKILGFWDQFIYDVGAYSTAVVAPWNTACTLSGPYKIPNARICMKPSFSHKVPTMTVRGAGRPEAERVVETIDRTLGVDPAEVRRRNFVLPQDLPWNTGLKGRDAEDITVLCGDTFLIPNGLGTFASRSAVAAGNAVAEAAKILRAKLIELANRTSSFPDKTRISFSDGRYRTESGNDATFKELVLLSHNNLLKAGRIVDCFPLQATVRFEIGSYTYACGAHVAFVQVDTLSGEVKVTRYIAAHDCGQPLNAQIVEGQLHGGIAHGIGNSLFEKMMYDENGQILSSTLKDYLLPLSTDLGSIQVMLLKFPTSKNPLGIKGVGESGAIGVPAAIAAAIENALGQSKIVIDAVPVSPGYLVTLMESAH